MSEWLPHIAGICIVLGVVALMAIFPKSWGVEFTRAYGVRGTAPNGMMRRSDFYRGAALCFGLCIVLAAAALGFGILAERYPNASRANWSASAYMFGSVLLAGVALLCSLIAAWQGLVWRQPVADAAEGTERPA